MATASIDLDRVAAIDVHVHAERNHDEPQDPVTLEILEAAGRYFGGHPPQPSAQEVADYYRERNLVAVIFNVDDEAGMGRHRLGSSEVLEAARANPDVLIPFGSVDPHKGKLAVREAEELIGAGVRAIKVHSNKQED
jgi:predicted TIM-barrel fold metal-dependent hydrolase